MDGHDALYAPMLAAFTFTVFGTDQRPEVFLMTDPAEDALREVCLLPQTY